MPDTAIEVSHVSMRFNLAREKTDTLKEHVIQRLKRKIQVDEFYALRDISFTVNKGDAFALVGRNGSGKSTMLKLISKIYKPSGGTITVNGSVAPMIELGAGFDPELTASENIFLNGAVLGHDRKFMRERYDEILTFAELRDFEHVPVKNFSSGMKARLGFAIATLVRPDILIVDEVLSVGDFNFMQKCEERIQTLLASGTTLLLVSHADAQVRKLCRTAAWIDGGVIAEIGDVDRVCDAYHGKAHHE